MDSEVYEVLQKQTENLSNFSLHITEIKPVLARNAKSFKSASYVYPPAIFGRLFVPDLLFMFDKIIYSDIDAIYQSDIACLIQNDLNNNILSVEIDIFA